MMFRTQANSLVMNHQLTLFYSAFCLLLLLPVGSRGQTCNCEEQFDFLREKITVNYSGFRDKVTAENESEYLDHTRRFRNMVDTEMPDTTCMRVLRSWTKWFKDGHIQLSASAGTPEEIRQRFQKWERIDLTETEAKAQFKTARTDPIEGIWESQSGNYRCAIIRQKNKKRDFAAFVLKADSVWWMPGQVKFNIRGKSQTGRYEIDYFMQNHSLRKSTAVVEGGLLQLDGLGPWRQVYPIEGPPFAASVRQPVFSLEELDEQTLLLTIPTMNESYRKEFKDLIKANKKRFKTHPNLIIDCRGNGGGSDITYYPLRPFLYTKPMIFYYVQTYSTEDNNQKYFDLAKNKDYPWLWRMAFRKRAKKLQRQLGEYVGKKGTFKKKMGKKFSYPENVAILIDDDCASSCEQFILFARQSDKVTLLGENTAGIKDYGNLHTLDFPNNRFRLHYPTTRYSSVDVDKGIDNIGIPPNVRLGEDTEDWVNFAREYLQKK